MRKSSRVLLTAFFALSALEGTAQNLYRQIQEYIENTSSAFTPDMRIDHLSNGVDYNIFQLDGRTGIEVVAGEEGWRAVYRLFDIDGDDTVDFVVRRAATMRRIDEHALEKNITKASNEGKIALYEQIDYTIFYIGIYDKDKDSALLFIDSISFIADSRKAYDNPVNTYKINAYSGNMKFLRTPDGWAYWVRFIENSGGTPDTNFTDEAEVIEEIELRANDGGLDKIIGRFGK